MGLRLGVIGAGNMGTAILSGALAKGVVAPDEVILSNPHLEQLDSWGVRGVRLTTDNLCAVRETDLLLLAVKPKVVDSVLDEIRAHTAGKCVISIVAGLSKACLKEKIPEAHVVCVMPNTPIMLGVGACAVTPGDGIPEDLYCAALSLFSAGGVVAEVPENQMNTIIPVNGSSPAFFFRMIRAMMGSAQARGIDGDTALRLAAQTMAGAAEMLLRSGKTPEELIRQVCSPGGTTLAALTAFDDLDYDGLIDEAFERCIRRADELGR